MLKNAWTLFTNILTGCNIAGVLMMWGCAASVCVNPAGMGTVWPLLGLVFPFFIVVNLLFCIVWLFISRRRLLIPFIGFAGCYGTLRTYCPVNLPSPHPKGCIKVLSYNTLFFGQNAMDKAGDNAVAAYIRDSQADIVCLQEAGYGWAEMQERLLPLLSPEYPYFVRNDVGTESNNMVACFSRYPILSAQPLLYESRSNGSYLYAILLAPGDTVWVINNHLESNRLSTDDRERYKELIKKTEEAQLKKDSRMLASKVGHAGQVRAAQADSIAALISRHPERSFIVCGDFNDTPISYTRYAIARNLTDAYRATGNGPGFSFNRDGILVRIDHLLCTPDWEPYECRVDRSIKASDHYPIACYLKRKK